MKIILKNDIIYLEFYAFFLKYIEKEQKNDEKVKEEEKTRGGIFLPDTASKEKSEQGMVIAVGPGRTTPEGKMIPMTVKPGQKVIFTKYGPNEIKIENKEYLIASEGDILAVIE